MIVVSVLTGLIIGFAAFAAAFAAGYYTGRRDTAAENERLRTHIDRAGFPALERAKRWRDLYWQTRANARGWARRLPS